MYKHVSSILGLIELRQTLLVNGIRSSSRLGISDDNHHGPNTTDGNFDNNINNNNTRPMSGVIIIEINKVRQNM